MVLVKQIATYIGKKIVNLLINFLFIVHIVQSSCKYGLMTETRKLCFYFSMCCTGCSVYLTNLITIYLQYNVDKLLYLIILVNNILKVSVYCIVIIYSVMRVMQLVNTVQLTVPNVIMEPKRDIVFSLIFNCFTLWVNNNYYFTLMV